MITAEEVAAVTDTVDAKQRLKDAIDRDVAAAFARGFKMGRRAGLADAMELIARMHKLEVDHDDDMRRALEMTPR